MSEKTNQPKSEQSIRAHRKARGLAVLTAGSGLLLAVILTCMLNFISLRNSARIDVSKDRYYALSEKTLSLLGAVDKPVRLIVFFQSEHPLYEHLRHLLTEYSRAGAELQIEWADPVRDHARTEELVRQYALKEGNVLIADCDGKTKVLRADDLGNFNYENVKDKKTFPELLNFKGENAVSSAILNVSSPARPVAYFLSGHGERSPADFDERTGYSTIGLAILQDNIEIKQLVFGEQNTVPEDCDVLIIAGPEKKFAAPEMEQISSYLNRGGRLLLLLDAMVDCGIEPLMGKWGIELRRNLVVDPRRTLKGRGLMISAYAEHPVTEKMHGFTAVFNRPRMVRPTLVARMLKSPDRPKVVPLFFSSDEGWAEAQPENPPYVFNERTADIRGPVSMGVAVEKGGQAALDVEIQPTRIIVIGDSDFASNSGLTGGDQDAFMGALNWLLDREELIGISAKPQQQARLPLTLPQLHRLFWISVLGIPMLIALIGTGVWFRRRR